MTVEERLEELKDDNKLKNGIMDYFIELGDVKIEMEQIIKHGCGDGMIPELTYNCDIEDHYKLYKDEINQVIQNALSEYGITNMSELIPNWDNSDILVLDQNIKNVVWYSFAEVTRQVYSDVFENGIEYDENTSEKEQNIKVIYKEVGKAPKIIEIDNNLKEFQKLVDGDIEVVAYKNMMLILNEEGKLRNFKPNMMYGEMDYIAGNFILAGDDYDNAGFKSLTDEELIVAIKQIKQDSQMFDNEMECD